MTDPKPICVRFGDVEAMLRPLCMGDAPALQAFFRSHDPETVRLRYGYPRKEMDDAAAAKLVGVDQRRDVALGLFSMDHAFLAVGRYYQDPEGTGAEVAFVVGEETRGLGMAGYLLGKLAGVAREHGVESFWASVLDDNKPMLRILHHLHDHTETDPQTGELVHRVLVSEVLRQWPDFLRLKGIQSIS